MYWTDGGYLVGAVRRCGVGRPSGGWRSERGRALGERERDRQNTMYLDRDAAAAEVNATACLQRCLYLSISRGHLLPIFVNHNDLQIQLDVIVLLHCPLTRYFRLLWITHSVLSDRTGTQRRRHWSSGDREWRSIQRWSPDVGILILGRLKFIVFLQLVWGWVGVCR